MVKLILFILNLFFLLFSVEAQTNGVDPANNISNFHPSLAVVIGILCVMFFLTFLLLLYAKFCHRRGPINGDSLNNNNSNITLVRSGSRYSGIDKTVIESLPFFRYSSLKGSKEGLECAVCLSRFEDIEVLRLLPKCKHAFHINCVDQWLEKHSSCPLCRCKISPDDPAFFTYSNSMRFLGNPSELRQDSNLELFVQREESRRFKKLENVHQDEAALIEQDDFHKYNHRIVVSDFVLNNRWSSVSSSDLEFLRSEMLQDLSSNRFGSYSDLNFADARAVQGNEIIKIEEEMDIKRLFENKVSTSIHPSTSDSSGRVGPSFINSGDRRSVSEITAFSRFRILSIKNPDTASFYDEKEERLHSLWLPIARKTVQWYANREKRSQQNENTRQSLHV